MLITKKTTGQSLLADAVNLFDNAVKSVELAEQKLQQEIIAVDEKIETLIEQKTFHQSDLSRAERIKQKLIDFVR